MRPPGSKADDRHVHVVAEVGGVDEAGGGPAALRVGHGGGRDVALVEDEGVGGGDARGGLVGLADPVEADRGLAVVAELPGGGRRQVGVAAGREGVGLARDREAGAAFDHEEDALGGGVGLGVGAAAAGGDLHDVLREGLGEAGERAGDDPEAGRVPVREVARHDVGVDPLRDHRVGLGEDGAAGVERGLRREAAGGRVVARPRRGVVFHGSMSLRRRSAIRSTSRAAVASSVSRSLARRDSKACRIRVPVEAADGDDEGEAELRLVGVVELGEAGALGVGERVEAGAGLLGGGIRR